MRIRIITITTTLLLVLGACQKQREIYVCQPCDLPCDTIEYFRPGVCPHCNMPLVKQSELIDESALVLNEIDLKTGSGVFLMDGGKGHPDRTIKVYYHMPESYTKDSNILIVVPGAGRNGDSYRDAWVEKAEEYGTLILSPMYEEEQYPFQDYHLGGVIESPNLMESVTFIENTNIAQLDEETFICTFNPNRDEWIFHDFERLFDRVVAATSATQTQYDIFGHSAGGQILHRFVIFHPNSRARRILAANPGFYTLPDFDTAIPLGLKGTPFTEENLQQSFQKRLILFIGELDNENEQGGTMLRSPTVDRQGTHRLARGKFFFNFAEQQAAAMQSTFNWSLEIVPNVGHNQEKMGRAAADYLYGKGK